ncbi:efflux RND transporter periplasmic adaptor subunit [Burkholderia sola]|uniref:HlyD family secretion protein n=1 Tax=Burkholderia sola TaxID=2843302 RepID=UPI001C0A858B|nr:major facilitator superfamily efflux pump membrane fusion protein [Burkholderia cenocepacia]CAG2333564.1 major facilitator superfamily efflux pump membrane fusion protein [Burkholderia cenocepacia]CAG2333601.1 major facilitator superfamily efflux pump membrane fusion protein [Burkholderia cenocepacia]CAG2333628.1 major facilitator superfamily efflux pump membrane fusion protein [Burkholderia cenocepacia]CAG2333663.1 major facilitator superfamily efflux pump membrane fusion protein [Burkholde
MNRPESPAAEPALQRARRRYFRWFFIALAGAAGLAAVAWATTRGTETTDDAYVSGDVVQISPQIGGTVDAVRVQNADWVRPGDLLFSVDKTDARLALDEAVAQLAHAVRQYRTAHADAVRDEAQIRVRRTEWAKANDDLQRRLSLAQDGGVSREDLRHARDAMDGAAAALNAQQAAYDATLARTDGTSIDTNPLVRAAAARVRSAALALRRTEIHAPLGGLVTRRVVQVGQHVSPGTPSMALVPLDHVWVEANFKESQLRGMRAGQPVELFSDLYGSDVVFHGRVVGLEAGTGAAFAAVPAQNATGNWIKVVQRVPVRIALDPAELRAHPLRIGLSMTASVPVDHGPGTASASPPARPPEARRSIDATSIYRDDDEAGEALVTETIRANSGARPLASGA